MFNYFGGKSALAGSYQMPTEQLIIEPFAGGAGYSMFWLKRLPHIRAWLVELDDNIYDLWQRLLAMTPADILAIPDAAPGSRTSDMLVALSSSAASPLGSFATTGDAQVTAWMARDWPRIRERVAATRAAIGDRVLVDNGSYETAADITASWFIDPPYQHQGDKYRFGSEGIDYEALAEWATRRKGHVQICEAEPADWLPFEIHRTAVDQNGQRKRELIWYSHPPNRLFVP